MEGDQSQDRHEASSPEVKMVDGKDIERGVIDLLLGKSSCQIDGSAIRDCALQEKFDRRVKRNDVVAIGEERTDTEPSIVSTYRYESGKLYAEDVDKHMAILTEVITLADEIPVTFKWATQMSRYRMIKKSCGS